MEYRLLANHVWQAHNISVRDYKIKYNYPLTKALADDEWIQKMKDIGEEQKQTRGWAKTEKMFAESRIKENKKRMDGDYSPASKRKYWPECSREKVRRIGACAKNEKVEKLFDKVLADWLNGVPIKELCVSDAVVYRWKKEGRIPYRKTRRRSKSELAK